jgi:hypothetical protein
MSQTTTKQQTLERALVLAAEYYCLTRDGKWTRADQIEQTIDGLVGYRTTSGALAWPAKVRMIAYGTFR